MRQRWPIVCLALLLAGCGGSGGGGGTTTPPDPETARPTLQIAWGERSRAFQGPSSALSATITYEGSRPDGGNLTFTVDRPNEPQAQSGNYSTPSDLKVGSTTIRIRFYAAAGGQGPVVGTAETAAVITEEGTLENTAGAPLGNIATEGRVASVAIPEGQSIAVGQTKSFAYTALTAEGNVIGVSPGSFFTRSNSSKIVVNGDGTVTGKESGTADITVTIEGKQATQSVTVNSLTNDPAIKTLNLRAKFMVYSPLTQRLYTGVPGVDSTYGNRLVAIDPTDANITSSVEIGTEPGAIAIGPDNRTIYIGLNGESAVRRYDAQTGEMGAAFSLGTSPLGPLYAQDIAVHPTEPGTVAIAIGRGGESPSHVGVKVFDNGVARPLGTTNQQSTNNIIEWSERADTVYGINNQSTEFGLRALGVNDQGIQQRQSVSGVFPSWDTTIDFGGGKLYASDGTVADGQSLQSLGRPFPLGNIRHRMAFDFTARRAYAISEQVPEGPKLLKVYDLDSYALLDTRRVQLLKFGSPLRLEVAGAGRLAFTTLEGRLAIFSVADLPTERGL